MTESTYPTHRRRRAIAFRLRKAGLMTLQAASVVAAVAALPRPCPAQSDSKPAITIVPSTAQKSAPPRAVEPIVIDLRPNPAPATTPAVSVSNAPRAASPPLSSASRSTSPRLSSDVRATSPPLASTSSSAPRVSVPATSASLAVSPQTTSPPLAVSVDAAAEQPVLSPDGTSQPLALSGYRTAPKEELQLEIKRLRESADKLPKGSTERSDVEDLIEAHEIRLETGLPVQELVAEITKQVAELRGLEVKEPVRFRLMERKELRELLLFHLEKDYPGESLENTEFVMKLVGAIPEHVELRKTLLTMLSEQVAGLYDPDSKLLYIMKQFDLNRSLARIILAHEIGHALQDQHYELLSTPLADSSNGDRQLAAQAVIEGDATILMQDYAAEALTMEKLPELLDAFLVDQGALDKAPYFLQRQLIFPYMGGAEFLQKIILSKGDAVREDVFRNTPRSTEQILHPDKYITARDRDEPTTVSLPDIASRLGDGWTSVSQNVVGEFQIKTMFEAWREWEIAPRVADGWDGDQFVFYRNGDKYLLVWMTIWDSKSDSQDFFDFYSELLRMKRYKEHFLDIEFTEGSEVRQLPVNPLAEAPVHLRFRRSGNRVLTAISDSPQTMLSFGRTEDSLFESLPPEPL